MPDEMSEEEGSDGIGELGGEEFSIDDSTKSLLLHDAVIITGNESCLGDSSAGTAGFFDTENVGCGGL